MTVQKSTVLADSVLAMVEFLSGDELRLYADPYENGREHGWALSSLGSDNKRKVVFSQDRHSDRIVLYPGGMLDFLMQGNIPSDRVYSKRMFFNDDSIYKCAEYIIEYLK